MIPTLYVEICSRATYAIVFHSSFVPYDSRTKTIFRNQYSSSRTWSLMFLVALVRDIRDPIQNAKAKQAFVSVTIYETRGLSLRNAFEYHRPGSQLQPNNFFGISFGPRIDWRRDVVRPFFYFFPVRDSAIVPKRSKTHSIVRFQRIRVSVLSIFRRVQWNRKFPKRYGIVFCYVQHNIIIIIY